MTFPLIRLLLLLYSVFLLLILFVLRFLSRSPLFRFHFLPTLDLSASSFICLPSLSFSFLHRSHAPSLSFHLARSLPFPHFPFRRYPNDWGEYIRVYSFHQVQLIGRKWFRETDEWRSIENYHDFLSCYDECVKIVCYNSEGIKMFV